MLSEWRTLRAGISPQHYTMRYQTWHPSDGQHKGVVVCVHGLTRNSFDFDRLATTLVARGYKVICPDIVGRGRSDAAPDALRYKYATYMNDLRLLLKHERVRNAIWVGTSMGGILGMMTAMQNPRAISKLVLNDVGAFIPKAALERIASYAGNAPRFTTFSEAEAYCRRTYSTFGITSDEDWRIFTQNSIHPVPGDRGDDDYIMAYDPVLTTAFKGVPLSDVNLWPVWDTVFVPTLIVRGGQSDLLTPEVAGAMATCAHAELVEFDGCGHAPSLMVPDQIATIADFVTHPHKRLMPWEFAAKTMQRTAQAAAAGFSNWLKAR